MIKNTRKDTLVTRKRLLDSASKVFASKNYRDATIADICKRAKTNVAAVNYHFGNKESLYIESWRYSFRKLLKEHPPDGGVSNDSSPTERLRGRIVALIRRITSQNNKAFSIVHRELANPTGLLDEVMEEEIRPMQEKMNELVRELIGPQASDIQIRFCETSIIGQCIYLMMYERCGVKNNRFGIPKAENFDVFAEHVVRFSLAGIKAIREEIADSTNPPETGKPSDDL